MNRSRTAVRRHHSRQTGIKICMAVIAAVITLSGSAVFGNIFTATAHGNASEEPVNFKYYKSIEIQPGDTLWSIAETYMSEAEDASIYSYIDELKQINSLESNDIQDSKYLTVAYYDTEFK